MNTRVRGARLDDLVAALRAETDAEVRFDPGSRGAYSTDNLWAPADETTGSDRGTHGVFDEGSHPRSAPPVASKRRNWSRTSETLVVGDATVRPARMSSLVKTLSPW
jgi:hypothetical protein